jgi:HK97 family phage prohead protease
VKKLQLTIRENSVEIEGYVNAIERKSKPLWSRMGQFIERICKGAFSKAIKRNDNIRILLNHDWNKDLGGTKDGNLDLEEDAIGLKARATITDAEVVEKAKNGDLVGWSFGFKDRDVENHVEEGIPTRDVKDLDLYEVSLLDRTKTPAYDGTLVTVRAEEDVINHVMSFLIP